MNRIVRFLYKNFKLPRSTTRLRLAEAQAKSADVMFTAYSMWGYPQQLAWANSQLDKSLKNLGFINRNHACEWLNKHQ